MSSSLDKDRVKVCILTSAHPPLNGRVFHKEAKTLAKAGYNVVLIAQHTQHTREETIDGVKILPLPRPKNRFVRITKVVWKLFRLALKEKANVYHFHDPELILVGLILKFFGKKVIYDVHEDYPKQILSSQKWAGNVYVRKFIAFITNIIERPGAFGFDSIAAATPDIAKKFNPSKTILIRNLPILELIDKAQPVDCKTDKPIVIYAGVLTRIRGMKEIIQAMEFVGDKAELWFLGKWESEEFRKECQDLEGWKHTKYLGLFPLDQVYEYIKAADIGISTLYPIEKYVTSLPIKAFEYMACSLPMVMSNFPDWQETFGEYALFANPYSPEDIAEKVLYLLNNPDKAKQLGDRGRDLAEEEYNWEAEGRKLLDIYGRVLDGTQNE